MSRNQLSSTVEMIHRMAKPTLASLDDAGLLASFVETRDDDAFRALVQRHGPMVLGLCHRVLRDRHLAEDAFQATFLILAQKAGTIREPELLGNWLYGVACRTALKARGKQSPELMPMLDALDGEEPVEILAWNEMKEIFDEEIQRLPTRYRHPMILCYFQGLTWEKAAKALGWPLGTLAGRLSRAKDLLRKRLNQRGFVLSASLLSSLLASQCLFAEVPVQLSRAAASTVTSSVVSAGVLSLQKEVMRMMLFSKVRSLLGLCLLGLMCVGGGGALLLQAGSKPGEGYQSDKRADVIRARMKKLDEERARLARELEKVSESRDLETKYHRALTTLKTSGDLLTRQSATEVKLLLQLVGNHLKSGDYAKAKQKLNEFFQIIERRQQAKALEKMAEAIAELKRATKSRPQALKAVLEMEAAFQRLKSKLTHSRRATAELLDLAIRDRLILGASRDGVIRYWDLNSGLAMHGTVVRVDRKAKQVLLSIGSTDGVKKGQRYAVYEHGKSSPDQTGWLEITKVESRWSTAKIVTEYSPRIYIQQGNIIQRFKKKR